MTPILYFLLGVALGGTIVALAFLSVQRHERAAHRAELDRLANADSALREAFQALSHEALHRNSESFLQLAKASLGEFQQSAKHDLDSRQQAVSELVKPLRDSLERVDAKLQEVEKERREHYGQLTEQLRAVAHSHQLLQAETHNLSKALRSPAVRGRWGEIQLRRVVEMAGMLEHCDFEQQPSAEGEGGRLRPDLVVRLPGGKNVVVDAKAPLQAYLAALECDSDSERQRQLREHARQVRDHIARLGAKEYWSQFEPTPEFVVMFLPGETFFGSALEHDLGLIEFGVTQRVIPASPTTLIALLRAVAYGWRQEQVAKNAREISELGRQLHERLVHVASHFESLRRGLDGAVEAYNRVVGSLEHRVFPSARRFRELGATGGKELPEVRNVERLARPLHVPNDAVEDRREAQGEVASDS